MYDKDVLEKMDFSDPEAVRKAFGDVLNYLDLQQKAFQALSETVITMMGTIKTLVGSFEKLANQ